MTTNWERPMKSFIKIVFLLVCLLWPAAADLSHFSRSTQYSLPADIMRVDFAHETWTYRLFEDGTVKKLISRRETDKEMLAVRNPQTEDNGATTPLTS
jgi:hypothetical protein